jgi:predicted nucleotidyltransferase
MVEVTPAQRESLDALRRKFDITLIVAFGSRVKGVPHAQSDLDIGILCAKGFDAKILGELRAAFPGEDVDVALLNRADPLLLKGVSDFAVLLSGEERDLQEFRMYAFRRYVEHRPFFALEARVNARHLAGA